MRLSKYLALGLLAAAALPLAAQADDDSRTPAGWYGAFTAGISSYGNSSDDERDLENQLASQGIVGHASVNDNPAGWALGAGYRFNDYFALEADYVDLGTATADVTVFFPGNFTVHDEAEAKGETLDAYGFIPLSRVVSLFGKAGVFNYSLDTNLTASTGFPLTSPSANGTTYDVGVGVEIHFNPKLGLRAGLTSYHAVGDENTTGQQNIGLAYAQVYLNF